MNRKALISACAVLLLAGGAGGAYLYFKHDAVVTENSGADAESQALPSNAAQPAIQTEARRNTLRLVEQLAAVQDKIIRGDQEAVAEQYRLLSDIAGVVRHFDDRDWEDYVNIRTSLVYVLSGGNAEVLQPFVDSDTTNEIDKKLAQGIMNFAQGRFKEARQLFKDIDPRTLDISLVGPFALARASLYLDMDARKAIELLDEARLSSPHTAIEEAAARREIPLVVSAGEKSRALLLTSDYIRRFGKSIYAKKLFRDFAEATAKRDDLDDAGVIVALVTAIDGTDPQVAANLFLDVAGEAILRGRLVLAKAAAAQVLTVGKGSEEDLEQAKLYQAAAEAPSGRAGDAMKALGSITAGRLSEDDTEIREVAGYIARVVAGVDTYDHVHPQGTAQQNAAAAQSSKSASAIEIPEATAALENADATLKQADLLISGSIK